uniref:cytochrome c oxidase assembly protein COX19-like n=1 Tax=Jaculus jaculus TaxID=51337 RepID=UPI001E1B49F7|nr:cytochrome c oxidase assembly protein COX19-like [Jaculus jaculus]
MSTAMNFGTKSFQPWPLDKGSFPLDHFGECKNFKEKFMKCLRDNRFENALCRNECKEYSECRMERQLVAAEPLEKLGFADLMDGKSEAETSFDEKATTGHVHGCWKQSSPH